MTFSTALNALCESLNTTSKDIASRCGISASALSRYRKGERTPDLNGEAIGLLSRGISEISRELDMQNALSEEDVRFALTQSILEERTRGSRLCERVDLLMKELGIRNSELANALKVDPSYLSRIRSQQRIPADQQAFARRCAQYTTKYCHENNCVAKAKALINLEEPDPTKTKLTREISRWLLQ